MKLTLCIFIYLLTPLYVFSQDSLAKAELLLPSFIDTLPKKANDLLILAKSPYDIRPKLIYYDKNLYPYYINKIDSTIQVFENNSGRNNRIDSLIIGKILIEKCWLYTVLGDFENALIAVKTSEKMGYPIFELYDYYANLYFNLKEYDEAVNYYEKDISFRKKYNWPTYDCYTGIGLIKLELKEYSEAIKYFTISIEEYKSKFPAKDYQPMTSYIQTYLYRGNAYLFNGQKAKACQDWKKSVELDPENVVVPESRENIAKNCQ